MKLKNWNVWLSKIVGVAVALTVMYFLSPSIKAFYARHMNFTYLLFFGLIGFWVYTTIRDWGKTETDGVDEE